MADQSETSKRELELPKEHSVRMLTFQECMTLMRFPRSLKTFEKRIDEVIEHFNGPMPTDGTFTVDQLQEFQKNWCEIQLKKRLERRRKRKAKRLKLDQGIEITCPLDLSNAIQKAK